MQVAAISWYQFSSSVFTKEKGNIYSEPWYSIPRCHGFLAITLPPVPSEVSQRQCISFLAVAFVQFSSPAYCVSAQYQVAREEVAEVVTALTQWGGDGAVVWQWGITTEHVGPFNHLSTATPTIIHRISIHVRSEIWSNQGPGHVHSLFRKSMETFVPESRHGCQRPSALCTTTKMSSWRFEACRTISFLHTAIKPWHVFPFTSVSHCDQQKVFLSALVQSHWLDRLGQQHRNVILCCAICSTASQSAWVSKVPVIRCYVHALVILCLQQQYSDCAPFRMSMVLPLCEGEKLSFHCDSTGWIHCASKYKVRRNHTSLRTHSTVFSRA